METGVLVTVVQVVLLVTVRLGVSGVYELGLLEVGDVGEVGVEVGVDGVDTLSVGTVKVVDSTVEVVLVVLVRVKRFAVEELLDVGVTSAVLEDV